MPGADHRSVAAWRIRQPEAMCKVDSHHAESFPVVDDFTKRDLEIMSDAVNYRRWMLTALVCPNLGARVLEIGSGIGNYSTGILSDPKVQSLTCVELDPLCIAQCRSNLERLMTPKRVDYIHGDFLAVDLPSESFDTVVCLNVLEHLEDDVKAVTKAQKALVPGGRMILFVPAFQAIAGGIDVRLGHYRRYTKRTASTLLLSAGFAIESMRYWNLAGFFGWFVRFRVMNKDHQSPGVVGFFDRVVFPCQTWLESRTPWQPLGQSLFVLARKLTVDEDPGG